ncbi:tyrosine-type recombinase/integrase [uncultured Thiohalocapsa sp.]|uniref:tyrosine-type recombinase/integrase n=1 Tax=uncultured Thiohalocapsa sp. TaxID=768990 RepID=UPI0025D3DDAB|nr:tyrosine-type recombinase/integrase [uncultured Thiohalocapsa sp.]
MDTGTPTNAVKLTKRAVEALTYQGTNNGAWYVWDSQLKGFGVRVFPSGRKSFLVSYRSNGRRRFFTLGTFGKDMTADEARKTAKAALGDAARGQDPAATKEAERRGETMADLAAAYLDRHASTKKSGADDRRRLETYILPRWRNLKAKAVKRADVAALHSKIGKAGKPYEANRVLALLSKLFELARRWGYVPEDHVNPARDIDRFKEQKRDRWITPEELPHLAAAINAEPNESARFGLWLYLLTGARKSELLQARWEDVDEARGTLRLADTKAGRTHYIPLSGPALALLRELPRQPGNPYILPGHGPRGATAVEKAKAPAHLVNISKPWNRVRTAATLARWRDVPEVAALIDRLTAARAAAKSKHAAKDWTPAPSLADIREAAAAEGVDLPPAIDDVRLHDLRRTVGSWLAQAGNSLHLIGRVLNHSNASTTQVYARFGEDTVRAALEQHGARILGSAGLAPAADVAHLPAPVNRCGTCTFWAEDHRNAPGGLCIAQRSPYFKKNRGALAEACRRYAHDDEAPDLSTRTAAG